MALRLRRLTEISRLVLKLNSGINCYQPTRGGISLLYLDLENSRGVCTRINDRLECGSLHVERYSAVPKKLHETRPEVEFLSFIESTFDELEGPSHRWLNRMEDSKCHFKKDGIFLILTSQFVRDSLVSDCNSLGMFEKVKSLQQRYPSLKVMSFQYSESIPSNAACSHLFWRIMTGYITFPVLLSNKYYSEMKDGASYIIFKDIQSPLTYLEKDVDLGSLDKAVKDLTMELRESPRLVNKLESTWANPVLIVKEPHLSSFLQNLLLYFPGRGCISVDEGGNRLFLSDVNHHRIIIFDNNGKILDAIGSSPGFEDAEFENAKLMRPAASLYHALKDCLYFVDSENHAIRRADMERRMVETIYPTNTVKKNSSLWSWVLDKLWRKGYTDAKSEELHSDSFLFPWHLLKSTDNDLLVLNRSFETLWIMDLTSGTIREIVKGFPKILEICGQMIMEKSRLLKQMPDDWMQQQNYATCSLDGIPHAGLMSSIAKFKDHLVICDAVGQMVLKLDANSGSISSFQFSNFDVLGFPCWFSFPLERVCAADEVFSQMHIDHIQRFSLLPGRVKIMLNIEIPGDTDLVEPFNENSVWREARGAAAVEIPGTESKAASTEKVGVSQQWYDEIDSLTFATSELESSTIAESRASDEEVEEGSIHIDCTVSTSPGTSEVIICAPLYLRLKRSSISSSNSQAKVAARLADILDPIGIRQRDSFIHFILTTKGDLGELVFVKPLHVRLKFDCGNHPKAKNSKDVILTSSSVEVNVAL